MGVVIVGLLMAAIALTILAVMYVAEFFAVSAWLVLALMWLVGVTTSVKR